MKANVPKMQDGIAKPEEFSYTRKPRILKAYGKEYELPVRNAKFSKKLLELSTAIGETKDPTETVCALKNGIALYIGEEETERIFPADKIDEVDIDEIMSFWGALNYEIARSQNEIVAKYQNKG